ncbi:MAG TPA: AMP-binding protein [Xanthobacteraceae bacterium]|jgi:phenylacetate-CoA ligase
MRAPFFRGKLDHIDLDRLDNPAEWHKIPILEKDMLRGISDVEFYRDFCLAPDPGDHVTQYWRSGGTTGRPLFYPRSSADIEAATHGFARVYECAGASRSQRVHCAFPLGIHPVGQMMARAAESSGLGAIVAGAGNTTTTALQIELIEKLKPDIFVGMSSYALHLASSADWQEVDLAAGSVKLVICSAEPLSHAKRDKLARTWGAEVRDSFGMTEAGMMAAEDGEADGFRVWTDLFFVEVVDPQSQQPVGDGEVGALVVTPLFTNNITPFLRWMSGDMVTLRQDVGGKGFFSVFPVLRHAHRTSGFFKVRGVNINHVEFEDFMMAIEPINNFKCEAVWDGELDALRVSVEIKRGASAADAIKLIERETKRVFEVTPTVIVLEPGALAREFEAAIKAPRMRDLRS